MKRILGVYDVDPVYASRFAEYANQKEQIPFMVMAFSSLEKLKVFTGQEPLEILLAGEGVGENGLADVKAGQIMWLCENRGALEAGGPSIYKYQSCDAVLREVMACYQAQPEQEPWMMGIKCTVIGVYSPINRCGKTSFSLILGQILARETRTLFISLEEHSGLSRLTGAAYTGSLSDLLYYYHLGEYSRMRLGAVLYNWGGLDYIPPAAYAEDLAEVKGEQLAGLVARIAADGAYDTLLLDFGHLGRGMEPLLELCNIIYTPTKEDCVSAAKLEEWKGYLEHSGRLHLWNRVRLLKLPLPGMARQAGSYLEQLLWGELGDYVRSMLEHI